MGTASLLVQISLGLGLAACSPTIDSRAAAGAGGGAASTAVSSTASGAGAGLPTAPCDLGSEEPIQQGGVYGSYRVESIVTAGAEPGQYDFVAIPHSLEALDADVVIRRDCTDIADLAYPWRTTVGVGLSFEFAFKPAHLSFTVTRAKSGTENLYDVPKQLFDHEHVLIVQ